MENINLTPIIEAFIAVLSLVVTTFLIPWLKEKVAIEKLEKTKKWVAIAVEAAENRLSFFIAFRQSDAAKNRLTHKNPSFLLIIVFIF